MECLNNLVEYWDGCSTKTAGQTYIDELAGFENELLADLTTGAHTTELAIFNNAKNRASRRLTNDIYSNLDGRTSVNSIVDNARAGYYGELRNGLNSTAYQKKGIGIFYNGNAGLKLNINNISLAARNTGTILVEIRDAHNPSLVLQSYSVSAIADTVVNLPVNYSVISTNARWGVFVCVDAAITTLESKISKLTKCSSCPDAEPICLDGYTMASGAVWRSSGKLQNRNDTGGLSVDYAIECDLSQYICRSAKRFTEAMLFATGVELMTEAIHSRRLNTTTLLDRNRLEQNRSELANLYSVALKSVVENWQMPNDACFCKQPLVTSKNLIP